MYIWESKRDLLYFKNRETLRKAIEEAKGNGEFVISKMAEELLDTLAKNNIALEAKYVKDTQQHDD
jgi:hypothetical protein